MVLTIGYYLTMIHRYMKLNILRYEKRLCIGMVASMAVSMAVSGAEHSSWFFVFWEWQKKRKKREEIIDKKL